MKKRHVIEAIEKHAVDLTLFAITLVSTLLMFVSSSDPMVEALKGTPLERIFAQFSTGNQIWAAAGDA